MCSLGISLAFALFLVVLIPVAESAQKGGLADRVAELEAQVAEMEEILQFVRVETEEVRGLAGPHWIIEGANVHVRSGSGNTHDSCDSLHDPDFPNCESLTGLGNLIVGYNEPLPPAGARPRNIRTGSHNLIVGEFHTYSSFGGFVAGIKNAVTGWGASVCGGSNNEASGAGSSVSGGQRNLASDNGASVSGGQDRVAPDENNWAAGELFEEN